MAANQTSPLFRLLTPLLQTLRPSATASTSGALRHIPSTSSSTFLTQRNGITTTSSAFARPKGNVQKKDPRITLIRYHLQHPKTPRPLRLSRMRGLRHWTIHRAWMLYQRNLKEKEGLELERMYRSMHDSCEELRLLDGPGEKDGGRLYRVAMEKKGIFKPNGLPIEYARAQTETPGREPWNHAWTR